MHSVISAPTGHQIVTQTLLAGFWLNQYLSHLFSLDDQREGKYSPT